MPYSDLTAEEQILLAVECVGRGIPVPQEIGTSLGPDLLRDIENPETHNHDNEDP